MGGCLVRGCSVGGCSIGGCLVGGYSIRGYSIGGYSIGDYSVRGYLFLIVCSVDARWVLAGIPVEGDSSDNPGVSVAGGGIFLSIFGSGVFNSPCSAWKELAGFG